MATVVLTKRGGRDWSISAGYIWLNHPDTSAQTSANLGKTIDGILPKYQA